MLHFNTFHTSPLFLAVVLMLPVKQGFCSANSTFCALENS